MDASVTSEKKGEALPEIQPTSALTVTEALGALAARTDVEDRGVQFPTPSSP
jgi:hypothetical protein